MALRLVHIYLPKDSSGFLDDLREKFNIIEHYEIEEKNRKEIKLLLDAEMTEPVLDFIENRYGFQEGFRVIVTAVEAVIPRLEVEEQPQTDEIKQKSESEAKRIHREELYEDINSVSSGGRTFILLVILSAFVAAIGLLRANVAIIIGAMVIAPLLGPNMGMALAATLGDSALAKRSLKTIFTGIAVAMTIAIALGWFATVEVTNPEIASRLDVSYTDFVLALASGAAGALSFTSGAPGSLIGVMVAVALMPPLMVFGLLIGDGQFQTSLYALLLLTTNVVCVNISGVAMFLYQGVRPFSWWEAKKAKKQTRIAIAVWMVLLAMLTILIHIEFG
ncbi:MAG: TIGR00341 family protein [Deltaproteobacteria bacterium]|nr:TIGR00341 family protein [Deltaproteobacteria bacterium]